MESQLQTICPNFLGHPLLGYPSRILSVPYGNLQVDEYFLVYTNMKKKGYFVLIKNFNAYNFEQYQGFS